MAYCALFVHWEYKGEGPCLAAVLEIYQYSQNLTALILFAFGETENNNNSSSNNINKDSNNQIRDITFNEISLHPN